MRDRARRKGGYVQHEYIQKSSTYVHEQLLTQVQQFEAQAAESRKRLQILLSHHHIDKALTSICLDATALDENKTLGASDQQKIYGMLLLQALLANDKLSLTDAEFQQRIHVELFRYNYNAAEYVEYYIQHIAYSIGQFVYVQEQLGECYRWQKVVSQYPERPGFVHDAARGSSKDQVLNWLRFEIRYHELILAAQSSGEQRLHVPLKLHFNLSVTELAYLLRILTEGGILNSTLHEVGLSITQYAETKQKGILSLHSLKNKYYDVEAATQQAIKKALSRLIQRIQ